MREIRGNEISMIFQEPMTSLNPAFTVGQQISEALVIHEKLSKKEAMKKSVDLLKACWNSFTGATCKTISL